MYNIVIPSRNAGNLQAAVQAIRAAGEEALVIAVDDGLDFNDWPCVGLVSEDLARLRIRTLEGAKPFCFARNANLGILASGGMDVVLVNDDVTLQTVCGFRKLQECARIFQCGAVSPRVIGPAHPIHAARHVEYSAEAMLVRSFPFACVYLTRQALDQIGLLDEQFEPGGYEDNDWCKRARHAGVNLAVCNNVFVDHGTLPHTFRPAGQADTYNLPLQRSRFKEKWGVIE